MSLSTMLHLQSGRGIMQLNVARTAETDRPTQRIVHFLILSSAGPLYMLIIG